jgi:hypothetical protein
VSLALPLLDAMVPAFTPVARSAANPVRRLGFVYVPFGAPEGSWIPAAEGSITELPAALKPLEPFRQQLVVPTGLEIQTGIRRAITPCPRPAS